jgi:hypothetical protein
MQAFALMLTERGARAAAVEALRQEWEQARAEATAQPSRASGTRAFRAALLLARFYAVGDDDARARAVAETAIGIVSDQGQRDILRLFLARSALDAGDDDAYDEWLADVNPQPVHLEVDSALRLTRAKRALSASNWDGVMELVGSYPSEVPLSAGSEKAARFVRAHAFAGRGDVVSARRELRGALATGGDPHELVRILLDEYPGPAANIAREEASQPHQAAFGQAITAPAAAAAYATAGRRTRKAGVFASVIGCLSFAPMLIFLVPVIAPSLFMSSCGMGDVEAQLLRKIESCPPALSVLGTDVGTAPGWSCGDLQTAGGSGSANWSFAVSGSEGRGSVSFFALEIHNTWSLQSATLDAGGQAIDLLACAGNAGQAQPGVIEIPGLPGGLAIPGGTGSTGANPSNADPLNIGATVLELQCNGGDMGACHALGMMYQTIPEMRDDDKARELNQRACDGGHSGACNALGR